MTKCTTLNERESQKYSVQKLYISKFNPSTPALEMYNFCTLIVCSIATGELNCTKFVQFLLARIEPRRKNVQYLYIRGFLAGELRVQLFHHCFQQSTLYNQSFLHCTIMKARVQLFWKQLYTKYNRRKSAFSDCTTSSTFCTALVVEEKSELRSRCWCCRRKRRTPQPALALQWCCLNSGVGVEKRKS